MTVVASCRLLYVSHLASDSCPQQTVCGEPWQGWQEPQGRADQRVIAGEPLPPHEEPRAHVDQIRFCQACRRRAMELAAHG